MNSHIVSEHTGLYGNGQTKGSMSGGVTFQGIRNTFSGFTLVEILVTLAIFAIIATTIFGSYNMVFTSAETIQEGIVEYEMAKNCLSRMIVDLQSIHAGLTPAYTHRDIDDPPDPYRIVGDKTYAGAESFARLRFTSLAHVPFGGNTQGGIAQIVYYVQEADENQYVLRRSDSLYPYKPIEENTSDPVLCEKIKSLKFTYYDKEGTSYEIWDSDSEEFGYATPRSIGIQLEIGNEQRFFPFETMITLPISRDKKE